MVKNLPAMPETRVWSLVGKILWRRQQQSTPVFWPGESHGQRSLWGHKELDTTETLTHTHKVLSIVRKKQNKWTDNTGTTQGGKSRRSAKILETRVRGEKMFATWTFIFLRIFNLLIMLFSIYLFWVFSFVWFCPGISPSPHSLSGLNFSAFLYTQAKQSWTFPLWAYITLVWVTIEINIRESQF